MAGQSLDPLTNRPRSTTAQVLDAALEVYRIENFREAGALRRGMTRAVPVGSKNPGSTRARPAPLPKNELFGLPIVVWLGGAAILALFLLSR